MSNSNNTHIPYSPSPDFNRKINLAATVMQSISAVWISLVIWQIFHLWSDRQAIVENFGRRLHTDLSLLPTEHYAIAIGLVILDVVLVILLAIQIWRLASVYRSGAVFSEAAALALQKLAYAGAIALSADMAIRHLVILVLTLHHPDGPTFGGLWLTSQDLIYGIMVLFIFMLAGIFRAAAKMAEEQAGII
jgi:hypothetical protein